ncbi:MAG: hypothetical protein KC464_23440 [Myxococcales bacterium]|nr:hypothetical protein [Myxococcales bacterium]
MAARTGSLATALVAGLGLAAAVPGCTAEGSVSLHFDVPDDPALRPGGAASLTLVTQIDADAPRATTTQIGADGQVDLGDLPVADEVWLSAELRSAQGQLVGYGRASAPLAILADADVEATIPVRRPFAYIAGAGNRLVSVDASLGRSAGYQTQVALPGSAEVVADVAGTDLATVSAQGALAYVSTATHGASSLPGAQLGPSPTDAIATPDGAYLLVAHAGTSPQVSVIEVATGQVKVAPTPMAADRVATTRGSDGGWWGVALLGRATVDTGCPGSKLAVFRLTDPETATVIDAGAGISDVGGDARSGLIVLADRCGNRLLRFDPVSQAIDQAAIVDGIKAPTALAVLDGHVWAVGHDRLTTTSPEIPDGVIDAWLVVASADLDGDPSQVMELPPIVERVLAENADYPDQDLVQDLHANWVEADDLAISPSGDLLALTLSTILHGDALGDDGFGGVLIPRVDVTTQEYWLFDPSTTVTNQRIRTSCVADEGPCGAFCLVPDWSCLPDIDASVSGTFAPSGIAVLFGAR